MTPRIAFRLPLFEPGQLVDRDTGYLKGIHPLADGTAVVHLTSYKDRVFTTSLVHLGPGIRRALPVPDAVHARIAQCHDDEVTRGASHAAPISFRVGDHIGLLVADRWAWLFDPAGDAPPVDLDIAPLPVPACIIGPRSYMPMRAGTSGDHRVPLIFRHPDGRDDYPCYLATLEIDVAARTARWSAQAMAAGPLTVPYRLDADDFNGTPGYAGTTLGDAVQLGNRFRVTTMGNRTHYGRMGMPYSSALETDADGGNPRLLHDFDESSHGLFSPDGRHVLLLPFFKSGPRKGKPSLVDLHSGIETALSIRGLAAYRPLAYRDGCAWFAGNGDWGNWDALVLEAGKPGELVACVLD